MRRMTGATRTDVSPSAAGPSVVKVNPPQPQQQTAPPHLPQRPIETLGVMATLANPQGPACATTPVQFPSLTPTPTATAQASPVHFPTPTTTPVQFPNTNLVNFPSAEPPTQVRGPSITHYSLAVKLTENVSV